jgi:hypothetical protein
MLSIELRFVTKGIEKKLARQTLVQRRVVFFEKWSVDVSAECKLFSAENVLALAKNVIISENLMQNGPIHTSYRSLYRGDQNGEIAAKNGAKLVVGQLCKVFQKFKLQSTVQRLLNWLGIVRMFEPLNILTYKYQNVRSEYSCSILAVYFGPK